MTTTPDLALSLEYGLTIAARQDCDCARYFILRRDALLPAVAEHADKVGVDTVDLFAAYARGVHRRHEAGLSLKAAS